MVRNHAAPALKLTEGQRSTLERLARSKTAPHHEVQRARVLVLAADGVANSRIAVEVGVSVVTVREWRRRFEAEGLANFGADRKGRGRKPSIPADKIEEIVCHSGDDTARSDALDYPHDGQSATSEPATVQRIWSSRGLNPHLVRTFKLSNDTHFGETLIDVVGLCLNPPEASPFRRVHHLRRRMR